MKNIAFVKITTKLKVSKEWKVPHWESVYSIRYNDLVAVFNVFILVAISFGFGIALVQSPRFHCQ